MAIQSLIISFSAVDAYKYNLFPFQKLSLQGGNAF